MNGPLFPPGDTEAPARWAAGLPQNSAGRAMLEYRVSTGSTQDLALAAAGRGAPDGAVFIAEEQSAGRGRRGAGWLAPAGSALLVSVLVTPAPPPERSGRTALAAALAACRAVESVSSARPEIKWPNDLLLGGRKFGGILVEVRDGAAAVGLGLNVLQAQEDFPPELAGSATSLAAAPPPAATSPDRLALLGALLGELGRLLDEKSDWENVRAEVERRLAWRGRAVRVAAGESISGRMIGLDARGALVLESEDGGRRAAASGSLELDE